MQDSIYFLATHFPRECGIATFTQDLVMAVAKRYPELKIKIIAMEKYGDRHKYPKEVVMKIREDTIEDYIKAAELVNKDKSAKLVNIQHEFGIFGGTYGDYLLYFLETLKKPVVVAFHSVIPFSKNPDRKRKKLVNKIAKYSGKLISISGYGVDILTEQYGIDRNKISVIPHGIPDCKGLEKTELKKKHGFLGKKIISTFGLLSERKGIEYVINALPKILKEHPEVVYLVIGETHPVVKKNEGESYRNKLKKILKDKKLTDYVIFYNKFFPLDELLSLLKTTDVYITPYFDPFQISSGTLAYAFGCGIPCISTPYLYARDLLREERGILVKFRNSAEIADNVNMLLSDDSLRERIGKKAYDYSRSWVWSEVAESYMHDFCLLADIRI